MEWEHLIPGSVDMHITLNKACVDLISQLVVHNPNKYVSFLCEATEYHNL